MHHHQEHLSLQEIGLEVSGGLQWDLHQIQWEIAQGLGFKNSFQPKSLLL